MRAEAIADVRASLGESPVWVASEDALYWVDIPEARLHRLKDGQHTAFLCGGRVSAIAPAQAGGFVAATEAGFSLLEVDGETLVETSLAAVLDGVPDMRMNDGALDRDGRFWAGSLAEPVDPETPRGALYCLGGSRPTPQCGGLLVQNGLAFSPDGRRLYVSDSHPTVACIWTFDLDRDTGHISGRRHFADKSVIGGRPDGATVDTDGCYWIAASDSGRVVRLTPGGRVDAEVAVPTSNPTNLCFGGADLRTLYITSMRRAGAGADLSGAVFAVDVPWQGIGETPFRR
ncbi:SMP-30/gluconolactonase/LRE family protein [Pelagibacterium xiamenense]|uniref:SMP-30/gluconolactonase/LRE family protein n=1 Tax=Pelagibacterium xiamenense TaxID=2901140 RepID=UPI001E2B7778|nr:SMP-30/gluconolactonase/LRE family protein [Pelagibacterium xiamenense]